MARRKNKLGQYIPKDFELSVSLPSPSTIVKYLIIALILTQWVFIIINKIHWHKIEYLIENLFLINKDEQKKTNDFF